MSVVSAPISARHTPSVFSSAVSAASAAASDPKCINEGIEPGAASAFLQIRERVALREREADAAFQARPGHPFGAAHAALAVDFEVLLDGVQNLFAVGHFDGLRHVLDAPHFGFGHLFALHFHHSGRGRRFDMRPGNGDRRRADFDSGHQFRLARRGRKRLRGLVQIDDLAVLESAPARFAHADDLRARVVGRRRNHGEFVAAQIDADSERIGGGGDFSFGGHLLSFRIFAGWARAAKPRG